MNKRLKIFSIILSVALVLPMQPLSANKQSNNDNRTKDLIEFKQTNTSEKKDDLNLYEKSIENNNFNEILTDLIGVQVMAELEQYLLLIWLEDRVLFLKKMTLMIFMDQILQKIYL